MAQADQKNATHTTHKKLCCFNQIFIIQNNYGMQLSLKMIQQTQLLVYMTSLIEDEKKNIQHHPESNIYRFGDGKLFRALQNVDIQIMISNRNVMLNADVVVSNGSHPFSAYAKFSKKITFLTP